MIEIKNKKANFDYFIEETYEAGIALTGTEIKSIRKGSCNLKDCYARVKNREVFLLFLCCCTALSSCILFLLVFPLYKSICSCFYQVLFFVNFFTPVINKKAAVFFPTAFFLYMKLNIELYGSSFPLTSNTVPARGSQNSF